MSPYDVLYGGITSVTPHFPRVQPISMHICHGLNIVHIFQQMFNDNILINISETILHPFSTLCDPFVN